MYSKNILNRFQNLKNVGKILNATLSCEVEDKKSLSLLRIYLNVENEVITQAKFKCYGNILTTVSADILCDILLNINIKELSEITVTNLLSQLEEVQEISALEFVVSIKDEIIKTYNKKVEKEEKEKNKNK